MRLRRSTWVASTITRPAPEFASMPRWVRCQSLATPSSALYWHMGETTTRLSSARSASRYGENRMELMGYPGFWEGRSGYADHMGPGPPAGKRSRACRHPCKSTTRARLSGETSSKEQGFGGLEQASGLILQGVNRGSTGASHP